MGEEEILAMTVQILWILGLKGWDWGGTLFCPSSEEEEEQKPHSLPHAAMPVTLVWMGPKQNQEETSPPPSSFNIPFFYSGVRSVGGRQTHVLACFTTLVEVGTGFNEK